MLATVSGLAGTGKDTVADLLCRSHSFVRVSFADPLKRFCQDVFQFTDDQLWGPSESRNAPDLRYKRSECPDCGGHGPGSECDGPGPTYLSPRHALQQLGTEWGRNCYGNIWVEYAIRVHDRLQQGGCFYDHRRGLVLSTMLDVEDSGITPLTAKKNVIIPDSRFKNELALIRQAGGKTIRVKRPGVETPAWQHPSETEQMEIPDDHFDYIVVNDGTLDDLAVKVQSMIEKLSM